jgi:DNA primase
MDAVRIEDVVGEFLQLKKRGSNLIGLCPFHNEKTPSFNVSPSLGIYKCFGCGKAGNSVNFLMEYEHYTYPEALRKLAKQFGVDIVEDEPDADYLEKKSEEEQSYFVHEFAGKWFTNQLWESKEGMSVGLSYFRERGLSDSIVKKFGLGYSPQQYDAFAKFAKSEGFDQDVLAKNGLINIESGNDRFRDRIIFPIFSTGGRIIAFAGRTLRSDAKIAKYVNSPETAIYHKSNILYGLHLAKNAIISNDECYLVEGYMDVIAMVQAGINNVVASSGTSLTAEQIRLIRRYSAKVCILYDGDVAGIKASFRAIDMLLAEGLTVRVVLFPDGDDPDSYARKHSAKALQNFLDENKKTFVIFKAGILFAEAGDDPLRRAEAMKDIVHSIAEIPDGIVRSLLVTDCSRLFQLEEKVLMTEMNKMLRSKVKKQLRPDEHHIIDDYAEETQKPEQENLSLSDRVEEAERNILRMLLQFGNKLIKFSRTDELGMEIITESRVSDYIFDELKADKLELSNSQYAAIFDVCQNQVKTDGQTNVNRILNMLEPGLSNVAASIMNADHALSPNWDKHGIYIMHTDNSMPILIQEMESAVLEYKHLVIVRRMDDIMLQMKDEPNADNQMVLLNEYQVLKIIDVEIEKRLRQRVINK